MTKISVIVAVDSELGIGKDNALPWHLPNDLKRFKEITTGHHIIMGRKTHESIGKSLPNRVNIVLSNSPDFKVFEGAILMNNLEEAVKLAEKANDSEVFIIGGAGLIDMAMNFADTIYFTLVYGSFDCDVKLSSYDKEDWSDAITIEANGIDEKHKYSYSFVTLNRIKK